MPEPDELTLPSPPRGKRAEIKAEWTRMAKSMADQGIDPNSRIYLLWDYINTVCEDGDLSLAWEDACLRDKIALSRRFSELLNQKLKLRKMLLAPEIKSQAKVNGRSGEIAVSPTDGEHGTGAWLSIVRDCVGPENASLMRNLLVELDAPREYCEAIEPLTGQVRRRARNVAIAETLTMFYGGIGATALARDWGRYANRTYV
jgi:hypothetical protein